EPRQLLFRKSNRNASRDTLKSHRLAAAGQGQFVSLGPQLSQHLLCAAFRRAVEIAQTWSVLASAPACVASIHQRGYNHACYVACAPLSGFRTMIRNEQDTITSSSSSNDAAGLHARIAAQIQHARTEAGLSRKELAERVGTRQSQIARFE